MENKLDAQRRKYSVAAVCDRRKESKPGAQRRKYALCERLRGTFGSHRQPLQEPPRGSVPFLCSGASMTAERTQPGAQRRKYALCERLRGTFGSHRQPLQEPPARQRAVPL